MLSPEIIAQRLGNITASQAHRIMAGWDESKPSTDFPVEIYDWIEQNKKKPLVGDIRKVLSCDTSSKAIEAAWKAHKYDKKPVPQGLITYAEELAWTPSAAMNAKLRPLNG